MAATSQEEFVDLYEVLELPTDAESETIRVRLNTLYLEAQQNLDHRNAKRRLQYQQMYEIYLPQARHLLLDPRRRGEYDRYLAAYRTGSKVAPSEDAGTEAEPSPNEIGRVEEPPIPGMAEVEVDPEVLAAEREDMWAKWKQGLELVSEDDPAVDESLPGADAAPAETEPAAPATQTAPAPRSQSTPPFARTAPPAPRTAGTQRPMPPAPRNPGAPPVRPTPPPQRTPQIGRTGSVAAAQVEEQQQQQETENEKRREQQRYSLIKDSVQNAGLMWGGIYAGGIFFVGCIILFILDSNLRSYPLGMSRSLFSGICFTVVLVAAVLGGLLARRKAKRRAVGELSLYSLEELMRRKRG